MKVAKIRSRPYLTADASTRLRIALAQVEYEEFDYDEEPEGVESILEGLGR
jgi:hypothetical protein